MKNLKELSESQLETLKQYYLVCKNDNVDSCDLANASRLVSMEQLEAEFGGVAFSDDDF